MQLSASKNLTDHNIHMNHWTEQRSSYGFLTKTRLRSIKLNFIHCVRWSVKRTAHYFWHSLSQTIHGCCKQEVSFLTKTVLLKTWWFKGYTYFIVCLVFLFINYASESAWEVCCLNSHSSCHDIHKYVLFANNFCLNNSSKANRNIIIQDLFNTFWHLEAGIMSLFWQYMQTSGLSDALFKHILLSFLNMDTGTNT